MRRQTHFLPTDLPVGKKSRARLAESGRRALIFVHGFGGTATGTWDLFSSLLPEEPLCSSHDLFFYGYESLRQSATYSAAELRDWLKDMLTQPAKVVNSLLPPTVPPTRPDTFAYDQITISAHSMGAVVTRRALLDLARDPAAVGFLDRVRIVLFAPAHMGGDIILLASEVLGPIKLALVPPVLRFFWPSLKDLEPRSDTLTLLQQDTTTALASNSSQASTRHLIAEAVIHGQKDRIVNQNPFCQDPPLTRFAGKGHMDVCKPRADYRDPITVLLPYV